MAETEVEQIHMPSIGEEAPPFTVEITQGTINCPDDYKGKWVILLTSIRQVNESINIINSIFSS